MGTADEEDPGLGFEVTKIEADLIFGDIQNPADGTKVVVQRTAAVNFYQNDNDRLNSGAPGYDIHAALKVGPLSDESATVDNQEVIPIDELKYGLRLRGADNEGQCYYVKESVTNYG